MTPGQKKRLLDYRVRRLVAIPDEDLEQQVLKNLNKWKYSAYDIEWARRRAEEYTRFFNLCK